MTSRSRRLEHKRYVLPVLDCSPPEGKVSWMTERDRREMYHILQKSRVEHWEATVRAYEAGPADWGAAWEYVDKHPIYWHLRDPEGPEHEGNLVHEYAANRYDVEMIVTRVRPKSRRIGDVPQHNTRLAVWCETGPRAWRATPEHPPGTSHDYELDCGGDSFEEAYVNLASGIWRKYGNDRTLV